MINLSNNYQIDQLAPKFLKYFSYFRSLVSSWQLWNHRFIFAVKSSFYFCSFFFLIWYDFQFKFDSNSAHLSFNVVLCQLVRFRDTSVRLACIYLYFQSEHTSLTYIVISNSFLVPMSITRSSFSINTFITFCLWSSYVMQVEYWSP